MSDSGEKVIPVRVAVRSRPLLEWEKTEGAVECVNFLQEAQQVVVNGTRAFTYDYIFDCNSQQAVVYHKAVLPLINGIFKGYNGTVLAYGQTGSGKTYSMGSAHCVSQGEVTNDSAGVIPRVIKDIFDGIEKRPAFEFAVKVSYVEIYKEDLKDLLGGSPSNQHNLAIRENIDGSIRISGLTEILVSSAVDTLEYMEKGNMKRSTGSTAMNAASSRSHAIFTIILESRSIKEPDDLTCSKFHLVDLAGSERVKRTKAEGERLQEGIKINAGLLALGNVISALGEGQHGQHIPYRVSKLTRLLQDSLGGNSLTVMIACISPADSNAEETINTLRYADRARKIKNKAVVNRDPVTAELVTLRKEVQQLRLRLLQTTGTTSSVEVERNSPQTREQLRKLEEENRQLMEEMHKLVNSNTELCEKGITTDVVLNKLQSVLVDLQNEAHKVADDPHDLSLAEEAIEESTQQQCVQRLRALHRKLLDIQLENERTTTEEVVNNLTTTLQAMENCDNSDANETVEPENVDDKAATAEHMIKTAKLTNQLQELSKALAMKEELAKRMCSSEQNMGEWRGKYEEKLKKLDKELVDLQNERDNLAIALQAATKTNESQKLSERRRVRLAELETQIRELKNEKKEKEKVAKLKVQSDQKITVLNSEIQSIKCSRVKLMRQIKEESTKFQSWRKEKEREVKQLKEKDRKRQFEIVKLERDFKNQKNVLRRKTEEAAASNKRLKEALNKQKLAAAKRQQFQSKTLDSANTRMKTWMEEDIEISVRSKEAKQHLETLEEDLKTVRQQIEQIDESESPVKRRRTYVKDDNDEGQRRKRELFDECELKEAQIKELKSKLLDAKDAKARQQTRFLQITSIAEARSIMKHLFSLIVGSRISEEESRNEVSKLHNEVRRAQGEMHGLEKQISTLTREKVLDMTAIENLHQEQVMFLTKQLNQSTSNNLQITSSEREADLSMQIKIQGNIIDQLRQKGEEFEEMKRQLEESGLSTSLEEGKPFTFFQPVKATSKPPKKSVKKKFSPVKFADSPDEGSADEISDYCDSDYIPTPIANRNKRLTERTVALKSKKKYCSCAKSHCSGRCTCRKEGLVCSDQCRCDKTRCKNNELKDSGSSSSNSSVIFTSEVVANVSDPTPSDTTFVASSHDVDQHSVNDIPYYNRVHSLFEPETNSQASSCNRPSVEKIVPAAEVSYKPIYFDSPLPLQGRNLNTVDTDSDTASQLIAEKTAPKSKFAPKKRKLLSQPNQII